MNELEVFKNEEFGVIRIFKIAGEPWFVGKDVANILGYSNSRKTINDHVDDEDKGVTKCDTLRGKQNVTIINESGLYSLILSSKLPTAKRFKRWVTSEVLPALRKTGTYSMVPQTYVEALRELADTVEQKEKLMIENQKMKPKALFADAVSTSKESILIGQLAKLIKQNGYEIGQNRLFQWLRENGFLIKGGSRYNQPTQKAMDLGLFEVKERTITNPDGSIRITLTTKVTGKGQIYFVNKFLNQ